MKKVAVAVTALACSMAWADLAKVNITWTRPDLYLTAEGAYIRTSACEEFAINEDAVLHYLDEPNDDLTFKDGTVCKVLEVWK